MRWIKKKEKGRQMCREMKKRNEGQNNKLIGRSARLEINRLLQSGGEN